MKHSERPTEMLLRQMAARRGAARFRNKQTGQRHFCHEKTFCAAFVEDTLFLRREIRSRAVA
jgi:hypothetical protein